MSLERKIKDLAKRFSDNNISIPSIIWELEEENADEELQKMKSYLKRRERINEIRDEANDLRVARCEAKMKEVGGQQAFLDLINSGEWSDSMEMTEIEEEFIRLTREEFHEDWEKEHGKPYKIEDDGNYKFGPVLSKEHMKALEKKMEYHNYSPSLAVDTDNDLE